MPGQNTGHDVRYDHVGLSGDRPRLTCRTPGCREATLLYQPFMGPSGFAQKAREFFVTHPPREGTLRNDDHLDQTLAVEAMLRQLEG